MKTITYTFKFIEQCNMCGAASTRFKVLGKRMGGPQGRSPRGKAAICTTIVQCRSCGLIFSDPLPIPSQISDHYGMPPESYWTPQYFEINESYFGVEIGTFRRIYGSDQPGLKALDIGAGVGKAMVALKKAGFDAYGLEPSEPFFQKALDVTGVDPTRIQLSSVEAAEYEAESFDFITFGAVLEHLYDPSAAIDQTMKWLKKDGLVHIEVPSSRWLVHKVVNLYYKLIGTDYVANLSPMHRPFHLYEFHARSFAKHARTHGYELAHHQYHNVAETYMPRLAGAIIKPLMERSETGMQLEIWLRKK